jgi:hypothetical protein
MRSMPKTIGRLVLISVLLAASIGLAYVFAGPSDLPDWSFPLYRMVIASLLITAFYMIIRGDSLTRRVAGSVAIVLGALAISSISLYVQFGVASGWMILRWADIAPTAAWLVVLGISGWLPRRAFAIRPVATPGWTKTWFAWTSVLLSLAILYGVSRGMAMWHGSITTAVRTVSPDLRLWDLQIGLALITVSLMTLAFVHILPRLSPRHVVLWSLVLLFGLLLTYLRVVVNTEALPMVIRRLANDFRRSWFYAPQIGPFLIIAAALGIVRRPAAINLGELPSTSSDQDT